MLSKVAVFLAMYALAFAQPQSGQTAFDAGRFAEARTILEGQRTPNSQALLARVYLQLQLTERAIAAARLAESTGAHLPEVQHQLEKCINRKVDVGFIDSFKPYIFEQVKPDLKLIYER